jgi:signal transduction histidine kinase
MMRHLPFLRSSAAEDADRMRVRSETSAIARFSIGLAFGVLLIVINSFMGVRLPLLPLLVLLAFESIGNQPYSFLRHVVRAEQRVYLLNLTVDILVIAVAAFLVGGLANRFVGFAFLISIGLIGATGGRPYAYWAAFLSTVTYVSLALLKLRGIDSSVSPQLLNANSSNPALIVMIHSFSFFLLAYFVAIPATRLRRDILRRRQAEAEVLKLNEQLEERVTERTAELEAANQELEAFSYSVSHDLRAPLRAMDGFSRIVLEDYAASLPNEAQRYLSLLRQSAQDMGQLVDDLLAFSRLGRQPLSKRRVAVGPLIQESLRTLENEQKGRRIELKVQDLPDCIADPVLLRQVFINLLSNSLKFTRRRDPARIEIGTLRSERKGEVTYFVRDNGAGFDMQYADKLFGVFQRLHRAEDYEGTGVGLAIVQRIVQRHGGRVWAEAEVDNGATFFVTLEADG